MTNASPTISPRRRGRPSDAPTTTIAPAAPIGETEAPPRVLIRLPTIAAPAAAPSAKPTATAAIVPSPSRFARMQPWIDRLNTPRVKKNLPYALAIVVAFGVFLVIRHHSSKPQPTAADSDAPAWNTGAALPTSQASGATHPGSGKAPNWAAPLPGAPNASPSAYQAPSNDPSASPLAPSANMVPSSSYQSNAVPAGGWQGAGGSLNGAAGVPSAAPSDSVPPMPARGPAWGNPPAGGDPGVVQGGAASPEYRTAQNVDPATIPPGHGTNDPNDAGVARFQGFIARPPQQ